MLLMFLLKKFLLVLLQQSLLYHWTWQLHLQPPNQYLSIIHSTFVGLKCLVHNHHLNFHFCIIDIFLKILDGWLECFKATYMLWIKRKCRTLWIFYFLFGARTTFRYAFNAKTSVRTELRVSCNHERECDLTLLVLICHHSLQEVLNRDSIFGLPTNDLRILLNT